MSGTDRSTSTRKVDKSSLAFHTDQGATDLIALLSISAAPQGGESKWVSAVAIHNELLRRGRQVTRPSLAELSVSCLCPSNYAYSPNCVSIGNLLLAHKKLHSCCTEWYSHDERCHRCQF